MTVRRAVIVHCREDMEHYLAGGAVHDDILVSSHPAVNDYLEGRGTNCRQLDEFISEQQMLAISNEAEPAIDTLLRDLDAQFSRRLCELLDVRQMRWFEVLYRYVAKFDYYCYRVWHETCAELIRIHSLDQILFYASVPFGPLDLDTFAYSSRIANRTTVAVEIVRNEVSGSGRSVVGNWQPQLRKGRYCGWWNKLWRNRKLLSGLLFARNILLMEQLYYLWFLKYAMPFATTLEHDAGNVKIALTMQETAGLTQIQQDLAITARTGKTGYVADVCSGIGEEFVRYGAQYAAAVKGIARRHRQRKFSMAIWGNAPVRAEKAIITEYCLQHAVPVVGAQHGNNYGENAFAWKHFAADFDWCDYYLTAGFTADDLAKLYPARSPRCRVLPTGIGWMPKTDAGNGQIIDILYVPTMATSLPADAHRAKPSEFYRAQRVIIKALAGINTMTCLVKLMPGSNERNCCLLELLGGLPALRTIADIPLVELLRCVSIRAVVLDFPTSPLLEVMNVCPATEIFLLDKLLSPYRYPPRILNMLEERVHYYQEAAEMMSGLKDYLAGTLPPRRDQTYVRRYYGQPDYIHRTLAELSHMTECVSK